MDAMKEDLRKMLDDDEDEDETIIVKKDEIKEEKSIESPPKEESIDPTKKLEEDIKKHVEELVFFGDIEKKDDLKQNKELLKTIGDKFNTDARLVREILGIEEEKEGKTNFNPIESSVPHEIILHKSNMELLYPKTSKLAESEIDKKRSLRIIPTDVFTEVFEEFEKMITADHMTWLEYSGKPIPYLTARLAKDFISRAMNISFSISTLTYVVPVTNDVKVRSTATIIDANRNVIIDGIGYEDFIIKRRGFDKASGKEIIIYGDDNITEKTEAGAFRRAIEYVIPPKIFDRLEELATQLMAEALKKDPTRKKSTQKKK